MNEDTLAKKRVGVLISGRGSNLVALHEASLATDYPAEIALVVSNRPDAPGLTWAQSKNIPALGLDHKMFRTREEFDDQIDRVMRASSIDIIACAGFLRLMTPALVESWKNRMINIHPALLPLFKGLDTHARAIAAGMKVAGCTVHAVRPEMDEGPILGQAAVPILPGDTPETLAARVLKAEHRLYPKTLALFASGHLVIDGEKAHFTGTAPETDGDLCVYSPPLDP